MSEVEETQETENSVDYEAEARKQGWRPLDEWKGDPDHWKDAQTFVEAGEEILPIVKSQRDKERQEKEELRRSVAEFKQFMQEAREKDKQEIERLRSKLQEDRAEAVAEGDKQKFLESEKKLEELNKSQEGPPIDPQYQKIVDEWVAENQWINTDKQLAKYADAIDPDLAAAGYQGKAYLDALEKEVKDAFPHKFENPKRKTPSVESGGTKEVKSSKARTYDNLPADAKAACDMFIKQGILKSADEYVENYDWE